MIPLGTVSIKLTSDIGRPQLLNQPLTNKGVGLNVDEAVELLGDARAKVSTSMDMSDKEYGRGFSAHVSIAMSVNQDMQTIKEGYNLCTSLCAEMIVDAFKEAGKVWTKDN